MANERRLAAVLLGNGLFRLANAGGGALVGFYLADLALKGRGIDAALVGALGLVANGTELLGAIPFGVLADRVSPRKLLVAGAFVGAAATQLFGISGLVAIFYLSRMLEGVAAAVSGPALLAHIIDVTKGKARGLRGRITGYFELSMLVGLSLGTWIGGLAWDLLQTGAFALMATLYLLVALLFYWGAKDLRAAPVIVQDRLIGLRHAFTDFRLRYLAPSWLIANAVAGLWLTHIIFQLSGPSAPGQYLVGRFSAREVANLSLGYALIFGLGIVAWGYALTRITRARVMRLSFGGMLLTTFCFYLLNRSGDWSALIRTIVLFFYAIAIIIQSGYTPAALAYLVDVAGKREGRGAAMGIYTLLLGSGTALGAVLGGLLARVLFIDGLLLGTAVLALVGLWSLINLPSAAGNENVLAIGDRILS